VFVHIHKNIKHGINIPFFKEALSSALAHGFVDVGVCTICDISMYQLVHAARHCDHAFAVLQLLQSHQRVF